MIQSVSGGDVLSDSSHEAIDYTLTSDNYKKWLVAQQALDSAGIRFDERIDVRSVSDDDVDRVAESLQSRPSARSAIEDAGMSVRDFVLTTVALAQSWDAVNGPSARVLGAHSENLDFLRAQSATDAVLRTRREAEFIDEDREARHRHFDDDSDSDDHRKRRRGRGGHRRL
ncbi:MAG: hypothetical protein ACREOK_09155 [Gemmatimonadaceae bacterium]